MTQRCSHCGGVEYGPFVTEIHHKRCHLSTIYAPEYEEQMDSKNLIIIVKNSTLPKATRLLALNEILSIPAPGTLKELLNDESILITLALDINRNGSSSPYFGLIYEAFGLENE